MKNLLHCLNRVGFLTLLISLYFFSTANAQHFILGTEKVKVEAGLNFGPTFFLGDLGGNRGKGTTFIKDVNLQVTKVMKGAFLSIHPNEWIGLRIAAQYTYLEGKDVLIENKGSDELFRKQRNLDFKSNMLEAYAAIEIFPLMLLYNNSEDYAPRYRPYVFLGAGMFKFNPQGSITDQNGNVTWHDLHPLRTEGQGFAEYPSRKPYALTQMNIPMGGGIKYMASERLNVAFELLYRKTFTDYIDDLSTDYIDSKYFDQYLSPTDAIIAKQVYDKAFTSYVPGSPRLQSGYQRGNPKNMDAYFSFVLKFGVRLGDIYSSSSARNAASKTRCPARF